MDHKSVIEEQIRELQKVQDKIIEGKFTGMVSIPEEVRKTAETIANLCMKASEIKRA